MEITIKGKLKQLHIELLQIEPKIDLLHDLVGCGRFECIAQTGDGYFLAGTYNSGFNYFLGKPTKIAIERTKQLLTKLSPEARETAVSFLKHYDIEGLTDKL